MQLPERIDVRAVIRNTDQNNTKAGLVLLLLIPAVACLIGFAIQILSQTSFPTWLAVLSGLSILIGAGLLIAVAYNKRHPDRHSALTWPDIGTPLQVVRAIEDSWNGTPMAKKEKLNASYLCTPEWLIEIDGNTFNAWPLQELMWAYYSVKSRSVNGIPTGTSRTIELRFMTPEKVASISVDSDNHAQMALFTLQRLAPWTLFGHTELNFRQWIRDRKAMIALVRERYRHIQFGQEVEQAEHPLQQETEPLSPVPAPNSPASVPGAQRPVVDTPQVTSRANEQDQPTDVSFPIPDASGAPREEPHYITMGKDFVKSRPLSKAELLERAEAGLIAPDTKLQQVGLDTWFKAWDHPILRAYFESSGKLQSPSAKPPVRSYLSPPFTAADIGVTESIFREYKRQYIQLSWLQAFSIPLIPAMIGILLLIYVLYQKPALCRRLAELGGNTDMFREHARWEFQRRAKPVGIGIFAVCATFMLFQVVASLTWDKRATLRNNMLLARTMNEVNRRNQPERLRPSADGHIYGHVTMAQIDRLRPTLSEEEVTAILGPPNAPPFSSGVGDTQETVWEYHTDIGGLCTLIFQRERLIVIRVVDKSGAVILSMEKRTTSQPRP